jgi:hypothetical protein
VRPRLGVALLTPLVLALALAAPARAGAGDLFDILQPGTRADAGLGGDPFLSPLDDACGYWSELAFTGGWANRWEASLSAPIQLWSSEAHGLAGSSTVRWTSTAGTVAGGRRLLGAVRVAGPRWEGAWRGDPGPARIGGSGALLQLGARLEDVLPGLVVQGTAPVVRGAGEIAAAGGLGMRYRLGERLGAQVSWSRSHVPERMDSDLYGEPISASLNLRTDRYAADARARPWSGLQAEYSGSWSFHGEISPRDSARAYEIAPGGTATNHQVTLGWGAPGNRRVVARWTRARFALRGTASWGGLRFAQLNVLAGSLTSWLAALDLPAGERTRWVLDAERASLNARGRGEVEGWPFTSTLGDLLALRMIGRATADANWTRWHVGVDRAVTRHLGVETGAAWYDIRPRAELTTWRPMFLVFGQTDVQVHELDARRVQLGALSLGLRTRGAKWAAAFEVRQFVFARTASARGASTATVSAPPAGGGSGPEQPWRWPGGTLASFSVSMGE